MPTVCDKIQFHSRAIILEEKYFEKQSQINELPALPCAVLAHAKNRPKANVNTVAEFIAPLFLDPPMKNLRANARTNKRIIMSFMSNAFNKI